MLVQISRRSYRAYTYTEVPIGTIELILVQRYPWVHLEQNDIHYYSLIYYSDSYHITVGIPRPVIRNE